MSIVCGPVNRRAWLHPLTSTLKTASERAAHAVQDCILITDTGASGTIFQDVGFCVPNGLPTPTPTATPASAPPPPYHSTIFSTG